MHLLNHITTSIYYLMRERVTSFEMSGKSSFVHFNHTMWDFNSKLDKYLINCHYCPIDFSSSTLPVKQLAPGLGRYCVALCQHDTFPTCQGICAASCGWLWHKINWSKQMRRGISVYPDGLWIDKWAKTIRNSNPLCLCRRQSQWLQWCQHVLKASLWTLMPIKTKINK